MKQVWVILCPVGKPARPERIDSTLEAMQRLVGGDVQEVSLERDMLFYSNEDAMSLRLPFNRNIPARAKEIPEEAFSFVIRTSPDLAKPGEMGVFQVRGDFFIARNKNGELVDVTEDDERRYNGYLSEWAACPICGGKLAYPQAIYCGAACAASDSA